MNGALDRDPRRREVPPAMTTLADMQAPSLDDIEALARAAFAALPAEFRQLAGDITFRVTEFPEDEVLRDLDIESPFDILGLFHGVGWRTIRRWSYHRRLPNAIWLYRRPILDYWAEHEETLGAIVSHVLVHEIGHHFGLSDDDMQALEAQAE